MQNEEKFKFFDNFLKEMQEMDKPLSIRRMQEMRAEVEEGLQVIQADIEKSLQEVLAKYETTLHDFQVDFGRKMQEGYKDALETLRLEAAAMAETAYTEPEAVEILKIFHINPETASQADFNAVVRIIRAATETAIQTFHAENERALQAGFEAAMQALKAGIETVLQVFRTQIKTILQGLQKKVSIN